MVTMIDWCPSHSWMTFYEWLRDHPDALQRLDLIDRALSSIDRAAARQSRYQAREISLSPGPRIPDGRPRSLGGRPITRISGNIAPSSIQRSVVTVLSRY